MALQTAVKAIMPLTDQELADVKAREIEEAKAEQERQERELEEKKKAEEEEERHQREMEEEKKRMEDEERRLEEEKKKAEDQERRLHEMEEMKQKEAQEALQQEDAMDVDNSLIKSFSGGAQYTDYIFADAVIDLTVTDDANLPADSVAGKDMKSLQVKQELLDQIESGDVPMADPDYPVEDNVSKELADMYLAAGNANETLDNIANSPAPSSCAPPPPNQLSLQTPSKLPSPPRTIDTSQLYHGPSDNAGPSGLQQPISRVSPARSSTTSSTSSAAPLKDKEGSKINKDKEEDDEDEGEDEKETEKDEDEDEEKKEEDEDEDEDGMVVDETFVPEKGQKVGKGKKGTEKKAAERNKGKGKAKSVSREPSPNIGGDTDESEPSSTHTPIPTQKLRPSSQASSHSDLDSTDTTDSQVLADQWKQEALSLMAEPAVMTQSGCSTVEAVEFLAPFLAISPQNRNALLNLTHDQLKKGFEFLAQSGEERSKRPHVESSSSPEVKKKKRRM